MVKRCIWPLQLLQNVVVSPSTPLFLGSPLFFAAFMSRGKSYLVILSDFFWDLQIQVQVISLFRGLLNIAHKLLKIAQICFYRPFYPFPYHQPHTTNLLPFHPLLFSTPPTTPPSHHHHQPTAISHFPLFHTTHHHLPSHCLRPKRTCLQLWWSQV